VPYGVILQIFLATMLLKRDHDEKKRGIVMNYKLKKQLITAAVILVAVFVLFAIIGNIA
jgi:hypothetical protein